MLRAQTAVGVFQHNRAVADMETPTAGETGAGFSVICRKTLPGLAPAISGAITKGIQSHKHLPASRFVAPNYGFLAALPDSVLRAGASAWLNST